MVSAEQIIGEEMVGREQALELLRKLSVEELGAMANRLREYFNGDRFDMCSIINARSGRCTEDCKWCSQSMHHKTDIDIYPLVGSERALRAAKISAEQGIGRFSFVTSGRALNDKEIEKSCRMAEAIGESVEIKLCASMGLLSKAQLKRLYDSGIKRYHCNLETAPSYFPNLCTTHTHEEKIATIRAAQQVGMEVCSGGIIGMGESEEQRIELAITLRDMGIKSIPLNVLNPIRGTALEAAEALSDEQILKTFAIFKIINPRADIRFAGGRTVISHLTERLLRSGVSAAIVGDMLTTIGMSVEEDKKIFTENGFQI